MKPYIYIAFFFFFTCTTSCGLPKQPELTTLESSFINSIKKSCNCKVIREIDPKAVKGSNMDGWYLLKLSNFPCSELENEIILKANSYLLAKELHNRVLNKFDYNYKEIIIFYVCSYNQNILKAKDFAFKKDSL